MADVLKVQSSSGTNHFSVDDSGNVTVPGALTVTGALSASGVISNPFLNFTGPPQSIDMADAAVELVYGITPGAGQVAVTGTRLIVDPNSGGAGEDLTIDTTAAGLLLVIANTGGENIVLKSNGGSTLATIAAGGSLLYIGGLAILSA